MKGISVAIGADIGPFLKDLARVHKDQLPFATAVALTRTARDATESARGVLGDRFTLRNQFSMKGIQFEKAKKKDWPRIRTRVGIESKRSYLVDHVLGVTRRPGRADWKAIPTRSPGRTPKGRVRKGERPSRLLAKGKARVSKDGRSLVDLRRRRGARNRLRVLYLLRPQVRIRATFPFERVVSREVGRVYHRHFKRELVAAIKSRRVRGGSFNSTAGRLSYLRARGRGR